MADWDLATAISRFRVLLGDATADKYEFKSLALPPPDGIAKRFFTGRTRVIDGTLSVTVGGIEVAPTGTINLVAGTFELAEAPAQNAEVLTSFAYQWFTDTELEAFLTTGAEMVRSDSLLTVQGGLRPAVLDFAASLAYYRKAAEFAESVQAQASGGSVDTGRISPNWLALAKGSYESGVKKVEMYTQSAGAPGMRFIAYGLPSYTPGS